MPRQDLLSRRRVGRAGRPVLSPRGHSMETSRGNAAAAAGYATETSRGDAAAATKETGAPQVLPRRPGDKRRNGGVSGVPPTRPVVPSGAPRGRAVGLRARRAARGGALPLAGLLARLRRKRGHGILLPERAGRRRSGRRGRRAHGRDRVQHGPGRRFHAAVLAGEALAKRTARPPRRGARAHGDVGARAERPAAAG